MTKIEDKYIEETTEEQEEITEEQEEITEEKEETTEEQEGIINEIVGKETKQENFISEKTKNIICGAVIGAGIGGAVVGIIAWITRGKVDEKKLTKMAEIIVELTEEKKSYTKYTKTIASDGFRHGSPLCAKFLSPHCK